MGFNLPFKGLKLLKKTGNGRLNNLNDSALNVLKTSARDNAYVCKTQLVYTRRQNNGRGHARTSYLQHSVGHEETLRATAK